MRPTYCLALLATLVMGCGSAASLSPAPSSQPPTDVPLALRSDTPSPSPRAADGVVVWALDRGPDFTPDQDRLRVYLFAVQGVRGNVRLIAPDGSIAAEVGIMGSGIFSADSCMSRVGSKSGLQPIGAVSWNDAAQSSFLADPGHYLTQVDVLPPVAGAGPIVVRLMDSGCRPKT